MAYNNKNQADSRLGLDTVLIVAPLREFGNENHRSLSNLPNLPPLQSAPSKNMIMCWWEREVGIWRVSSSQKWHSQIDETLTSSESEPTLLAKIIIRVKPTPACYETLD